MTVKEPSESKDEINASDGNEGTDPLQEQPDSKIETGEPNASEKKHHRINVRRIARSVRAWTLNIVIVFLLFVLFKIILVEIYDRGYHIQALRVPQEFELNGYDGVTAAYMILDDVNKMILIGNRDRSTKDVENYQQAAGRTQLQVEVGGIGISPETISVYIKQAIGIKTRNIDGEIVRDGGTLKCFLRISGRPTETLTQRIDDAGTTVAFEKLILQAAELVLKSNYPLILGSYYLATENEKAIEAFRYTVQSQPDQASMAYVSLAACIDLFADRDSSRMMHYIRRALEIDPRNASAYVMWGIIEDQSGHGEKSLNLMRKAADLDPSNINTWSTLGYKYLLVGENDDEAIACFAKCYALDSTYTESIDYWTRLLFVQGKFEEAKEKLEKLKYLDPDKGRAISIAIPVAVGDSAWAMRDLQKVKATMSVSALISELNSLADEQKARKHYDTGIRLIRFALSLDSITRRAAFPYATLAEFYGLKGDKEKFYSNLEKSIGFGFKPDRHFSQIEPYKTFSSEERYKRLLTRNKIDY